MNRLTPPEPTETENGFLHAVAAGERLDLTDGPAPELRAELIRQVVLDQHESPADPRGIWVRGARIVGALDLAEVDSPLPLRLLDCRADEPIRLMGGRFPALDLSGLVGVGIAAQEAEIARTLTLRDARLHNAGPYPVVHLGGCRIGGLLNLSGTRLSTPEGVALQASNLRTGGGVFLNQGFSAEGGAELGAVRLPGAELGGQLNMGGARVVNPNGPALVADYLRTGSNVMLNHGFAAEGRRDSGTVRLVGARIGGRLMCEGGRASALAPGDLAVNLSRVEVGGDVLLPASFAEGALDVNGLTYTGTISEATLAEWLELLATRTTYYASQPYFQLAAAHRAAGHERDVRRIHIARQRDLLRRGDLGFWGRLWHRVTGLTVGYGYRPGLALLWLLGAVLGSVLLTVGVAGSAGLVDRAGAPGRCSVVEQVGLAVGAATPLIRTDGTQRCVIDASGGLGQAVIAGNWVLQALTWAFLTLFVAGFTGLMRRSV
ncbi:hypothetical protein SAMN05421810_10345 [Amycolatopsis arida]|uniref:Oxidoreductase n=1 Tax=Amycolatopsis arida TaxID=587909 RepID=A0A1I5S9M7_9PSEU|nr:hypothetical protein [Amycolatopsis arida]TDX85318.1 hypothetical protein CLV69_11645 [Amycolatopsis arida]SFP66976.1 hypothetical protein SAMN05421810_10345 [Amycolatopsis arida]